MPSLDNKMELYLESSIYIDWQCADIKALSASLSPDGASDEVIAKNCFEWVRDNIKHSYDYKLNPVTCKASDVLKYKTGYCYAKSHLLAALLRAAGIPAGLCYQRLSVNDEGAPYCLHGLNAVYLQAHGWYRIDPRGNKEGVDAQFTPPHEHLAFPVRLRAEANLPAIWPSPLMNVVSTLENNNTYQQVFENLPDIELIQG